MMFRCLCLMLSLSPVFVWADWIVDEAQSHVGFASVKNEIIAENHHFTRVTGKVNRDGQADIKIELASVETIIPIRNDRMRKLLFEVERYPIASVSSRLQLDAMTVLAVGESKTITLEMMLNLHGDQLLKSVPVRVTRTGQTNFEVSSLGPILIHAEQFSLTAGIARLKEIAGLQSIDLMVPVSFHLRFVQSADQD